MLRRLPLVFAVLVGSAAACASFGSTQDNGGGADASTEATTPPPPPPADDASPPADAGTDADAERRHGCFGSDAAPLDFESFDVDGGWSSAWSPSGSPDPVVEPPFVSPPFALAAHCPDGGGCASAGPRISRYVGADGGLTRVSLETQLRVEASMIESYVEVGLVALGPDGIDGRPHLRLGIVSDNVKAKLGLFQVDANAAAIDAQTSIDLPSPNVFHDVVIVIDYARAPPKAHLVVDTVELGSFDTNPALPAPTSSWQLRVGALFTTDVHVPWTVRYDDLTFCAQ